MAGPYGTAVLDNFDRADSATLGSSWTADPAGFGLASFDIVSNRASGVGFESNWWNTQYASDQEAYYTIGTAPDNEGRILARIVAPGTTAGCDGYMLAIGGGTMSLNTFTNGVGAGVLNSQAYTATAGHKIALACVGSQIEAWKDTGSGWALAFSATNATYGAAGYIGIYSQNNTAFTLDDFGGGAISTAEKQSFYASRRRMVTR